MSDDADAGANAPEFKSITSQEEFDRRLGTRLSKFADYDDVKAKAARLDDLEAASKTELQKLRDELADRDTKLADLPREARAQAIRFASKATAKGFLDPEDALMFIDADLADDAAVDTALDQLAERKPHLVRVSPAAKKVPTRPRPDTGAQTEDDGMPPKGKERAAAALRQFRTTPI